MKIISSPKIYTQDNPYIVEYYNREIPLSKINKEVKEAYYKHNYVYLIIKNCNIKFDKISSKKPPQERMIVVDYVKMPKPYKISKRTWNKIKDEMYITTFNGIPCTALYIDKKEFKK